MNFKIIFFISLFFVASCGVKSPPAQAPETSIDSYIKSYTDNDENFKNTSPLKNKK